MNVLAAILTITAAVWAADIPTQRTGKYQVALRLPEIGLIAGEETQIEFRISDATQTDPVLGQLPIVRARIDTVIDMPEMPAMPKAREAAHPEGVPGDYGIHPTFPHGGTYRLTMTIAPPGSADVQVEFKLEVADRSASGAKKPVIRFALRVAAEPKSPKAGETATLRLTVADRDQITSDFELVHEKRMHLIVVSKDLEYFRHEHPELGQGGVFALTHVFPQPGIYHLFADVAPRAAGSQILFATVKVGGKGTPSLAPTRTLGRETRIQLSSQPVETGRTSILPISFHDAADGAAVLDLENYLGAKAHLILIHEDAVTFVHCHPDELSQVATAAGVVPFRVRLPKPGVYKGWVQFMRAGVLNTVQLRMDGR